MVKFIPLTYLDADRFRELAAGYTSEARYVVIKKEDENRTQFTLNLVSLRKPYVKKWEQDETTEAHYQEIIDQGLSLGAIDRGELIGLAICERRAWNRSLWVWEFHIHPERRGEGIGHQLMQVVFASAKQAGCRVVVCETQNTNVPAISFYRKLGFEIDAIDLSYYTNKDVSDGEVAIFMKHKLD
jgi:ribosomal protein S18 acetylase RimI-like enzyme